MVLRGSEMPFLGVLSNRAILSDSDSLSPNLRDLVASNLRLGLKKK